MEDKDRKYYEDKIEELEGCIFGIFFGLSLGASMILFLLFGYELIVMLPVAIVLIVGLLVSILSGKKERRKK